MIKCYILKKGIYLKKIYYSINMKKRQYRSNQGRNPKKEEVMFNTIKVAFVLLVIATIINQILS